MSKLHVAVLRGGPSSEYDISLKTGSTILSNLPDKYQGHDIFISKDGAWHRDGIQRLPGHALSGITVVVNALHGNYGEDGKVQKILQDLSIPYTGSDSLASSLGMNKSLTKKIITEAGIKTPYFNIIKNTDDLGEKAKYIFNHFFLPFIVKPVSAGLSHGVTIVKNFNNLQAALVHAFEYGDSALVEEYIQGKEATVGIINNFRGQDVYSLMPVEVRTAPYHNHLYPGNFSEYEKNELERLARLIHQNLGLRHYSRSDFIVHPRRGIYMLEVNTLPVLTPDSTFNNSLIAIGSNLLEFLDHIITLALS